MGLKEQLNRRDFRRLMVGQTVSSLGDWMGTLALMYFVLELSGSTTAVGGVLVLRLLPSALGAPVAARVVTRWRRRTVLLNSDLIRVGMAVALPVLPWLWWVYFWAFAIEVVGLCFLPARDAAIPFLIEDRDESKHGEEHDTGTLEVANGITMATSYGMIPVGAGAFGLLLWASNNVGWEGHWRYVLVFWLNALTYLVSYFAIRSIPDLGPAPGERWTAADRDAKQQGGFLDALRLRVVRGVLPGVAVVSLGLGALFSLGVVFVRNVLDASPVGFGVLVALFGVGAVTGLIIVRRGRWHLVTQIRTAVALQGATIAMMGLVASITWSFVGAVVFGGAATAALVGGITYLQESLEGYPRNLALTAFHAVLRFGLALAALLSGAAADLLDRWDVSPLGMVPARLVLALSGLVVIAGTFLIRAPAPASDRDPGPA
ncbi:putative MFS family arabinose efflux permease [Actinomadura pelletieri DSM 43383]|uniref:Putative MFS family arabinose efflux permease n=1 Tax=Actinomadura pelletieri DSM 43383 TaxID=1120940 RepID=A0A495QIF4_9ACTN|nr:MFS transporter [Actinomadura pelletieri]RKS71911.1 putative MFS family arabinose efflux permease [Actinomadura pelletieri DSM 43383]